MQLFLITLTTVGIMLAYAIPGFVTVKTGIIKPQAISAFAVILMYVCQPCLTIYSLTRVEYSPDVFARMMIFLALTFVLQAAVLGVYYLIFRKKQDNVAVRISNVAVAFGNVGFLGVPLLESIFPDNPEVLVYSTAFLIGMNLLGWTFASAIITRDKKYVSIKKAIFNPATVGLVIGLPLFFTGVNMPAQLDSMITLLGKMTTPLCMLIMGMRLAVNSPRSVFCRPMQYVVVLFKQVVFGLIALLLVWFLPLPTYFKETMFILACTPVASVVLNFAEMLGEGQETAANLVLLGTTSSIITIPMMTLILTALH
ncbi:MAG: AEC family transporter [Christensenellales bacterium]